MKYWLKHWGSSWILGHIYKVPPEKLLEKHEKLEVKNSTSQSFLYEQLYYWRSKETRERMNVLQWRILMNPGKNVHELVKGQRSLPSLCSKHCTHATMQVKEMCKFPPIIALHNNIQSWLTFTTFLISSIPLTIAMPFNNFKAFCCNKSCTSVCKD